MRSPGVQVGRRRRFVGLAGFRVGVSSDDRCLKGEGVCGLTLLYPTHGPRAYPALTMEGFRWFTRAEKWVTNLVGPPAMIRTGFR
jgi:hypothetical protein